MEGEPSDFWGKLENLGKSNASWHPLIAHCADVAACCEALLENTLLGQRLATLANQKFLPREWLERLCVLCAWHDIGKFNTWFQNKGLGYFPTAGHIREIASLFEHEGEAQKRLCQALPLAELEEWSTGNTVFEILLASLSHHGRPVDTQEPPPGKAAWERCPKTGRDPFVGMAQLVSDSRSWFPLAFRSVVEPLPSEPAFQHYFAGIVMLADWLGSDTRFFPFADRLEDRIGFARSQANLAIESIGLKCDTARDELKTHRPSYQRSFGFDGKREMQQLSSLVPLGQGPSLAILEAETGAGKTEAAYWHFLRLFQEGYVDGMYFALPTRTAATQVYRRLVDANIRTFLNDAVRPPVVQAVPGYISVDKIEGKRLPGFEVLWNDDSQERMRYRAWAAEGPKRYLAASIAVGTIDQVLLSALATPHSHMRAACLSRQLLVVDEVHASDVYMTTLLEEVLKVHFSSGGHAFLMSATLGQAVAARYKCKLNPHIKDPSLEIAKEASFPAVSWQRDGVENISSPSTLSSNKTVKMQGKRCAESPKKIAELAVAAAEDGASVLIIRNTVADCRDTQRAVEALGKTYVMQCCGICAPHHSRYAKEDRMALDDAIEQSYGKHRKQKGQIAVATQTVQQSLDLDADYLMTDLCPADVLLQRIGRLHRHKRARPVGYDKAQCVVLLPEERNLCLRLRESGEARGNLGIGSVYDDLRIIEATWRLVEKRPTWRIPQDNRELVELATHPDALSSVSEELGEEMQRHAIWVASQASSCRRIAGGHLVQRGEAFGSEQSRFPSKALASKISTRLGASDRISILPKPLPGIFGTTIRQFTIPSYWLPEGVAPEAEPIITRATEEGICFLFAGHAFTYDRLGLHREE